MIVDIVRAHVLSVCRAPENSFGPRFYDQHLQVVADYAKKLAERLGADTEIVETAAYLHDISAVLDLKTLARHAELSAAAAEEFLAKNRYPQDRAQRVSRCIASHVAPIPAGKGTPEEVCVSNADAISQIVRPAYWLYFVFTVRKAGFQEGYEWLRSRVETNWNAMIPEARDLITEEYRTAGKILGY